ncbi:rhodanese-like domain-containing protein [Methanocella sp. CWC-04]|uniref:Rhodanese-like domain-containing protein n=1 Tax=Methanooceanicella nereidis TaxID=2052831 RepID=A0AAP2RFJ6_9EURY|nr:rhodanese-like domain-containing protein [Methanocella sp. CWC-04]
MYSEHVKSIGIEHLKRSLDNGEKVRLLDVRSRADFQKEHIKGAQSMPLDELEKKAGNMLDKDENIITYCDSFVCSSSTSGAKILVKQGFKNVKDYKGGLREWKQAGYPTETGS